MIWLGATLFLFGTIIAAIVFLFNSQTPLQLGPIPFFGSVFVALVGFLIWFKFI